tara:strand:- start:42 stop:677 length:636 start_codon:yes stop_codon:yes gene_type:complete
MKSFKKLQEEINSLNESGLSRVYRHTREHDYGLITAFRYAPDCGEGTPYTKRENMQRNTSLLAKLRAEGYSVTKIKGSYIENYGDKSLEREVGENSFLVIDINDKGNLKKTLMKLGEEFEQDSIIFGLKGSRADLIGTNKCPKGYPGYHKIDPQGGALFGKTGEFMSRVKGRPFIFGEENIVEEHYGVCKFPTELRGPVTISKMNWWEIEV